MALGSVTGVTSTTRTTCLLDAATATTSAPTLVTDGVPCHKTNLLSASDTGVCYVNRASREALLVVTSSAGSGTMTVTLRLWGYSASAGKWVPVGSGSDPATKGTLNGGSAIAETGTDLIGHSEPLYLAGLFDRLCVQVTAIGGTATAISVFITTSIEGY